MSLTPASHLFTRRMNVLYISAILAIAVLALLFQFIVQFELQQYYNQVHVLDVADRQRMLSQNLCKVALEIYISADRAQQLIEAKALKVSFAQLQAAQSGIQNGNTAMHLSGQNSETIRHLFYLSTPSFLTMMTASEHLINLTNLISAGREIPPKSALYGALQTLLVAEPQFLSTMEKIVRQYEVEMNEHIALMQTTQVGFLVVIICTLLLGGLFVFRPAITRVARDITEITYLEERVAYMTEVQQRNFSQHQEIQQLLSALFTLNYSIRILAIGHYSVQDANNSVYFVTTDEPNTDMQHLHCTCELYQRTLTCSHMVAASSLHTALLEYRQNKVS